MNALKLFGAILIEVGYSSTQKKSMSPEKEQPFISQTAIHHFSPFVFFSISG